MTQEQLAQARALGLSEREILGDNINDMWSEWVRFLDMYEQQIFAEGHITVALFHGNKMRIALAASESPNAVDKEVPGLVHRTLGGKQLWNNSIFELEGQFEKKSLWRRHFIRNHYRVDDQ